MKKNEQSSPDVSQRLESIDTVSTVPMPAGWSRRNWVQREAVAFGALVTTLMNNPEEETP
jgi:hypothetical protein